MPDETTAPEGAPAAPAVVGPAPRPVEPEAPAAQDPDELAAKLEAAGFRKVRGAWRR